MKTRYSFTKIFLTALCVLIQLGVLLFIVGKYEYVIATGTEIMVKTRGYDPRDYFRGEYVRINYDISTYTGSNHPSGICSASNNRYNPANTKFFVVLLLDTDKYVQGIEQIVLDKAAIPKGKLFVKATLSYCDYDWSTETTKNKRTLGAIHIKYKKDRFFVKEGTGLPLEDVLRDRETDSYAIWTVAQNGESILSSLLLPDGKVMK